MEDWDGDIYGRKLGNPKVATFRSIRDMNNVEKSPFYTHYLYYQWEGRIIFNSFLNILLFLSLPLALIDFSFAQTFAAFVGTCQSNRQAKASTHASRDLGSTTAWAPAAPDAAPS